MSTKTQFSASRYVTFSVYPHPASSLLYAPPLLALLAISRFKLCGVRSRRRVLTCRMMRGPLLLLTIWYGVEVGALDGPNVDVQEIGHHVLGWHALGDMLL
jgi:hypothetical protein